MVAHCISQLGDARLSLEAGRLRTRLMQTRAPRRDSDLVVASPSRIENSVPVARCGKSYPITKKGLIITNDTSSSLSSMMWVPFNKPIIKGDKHEYRRGATTYLSQHVPKSGRHPPRLTHGSVTQPFLGLGITTRRWLGTNQRPSSQVPDRWSLPSRYGRECTAMIPIHPYPSARTRTHVHQ